MDALHRLFLREAPLIVWLNGETLGASGRHVVGFEPWPGLKLRFWNVSMTP